MWFRRTVMMAAAVVVVAAIGVSPAEAGGPTSVLLSAPSVPRVVAVGYDDKAYQELMKLAEPVGAGDSYNESETSHGSFIRATWLIHDMTVWRLSIIYPNAPGGPWIATTEDHGRGMATKPVWHQATDRAQMLKLLGSLGLLGGTPGAVGPTSGPWGQQVDTPAQQPAAQPPSEVVKADPGTFAGWRWSIPGFILGAVIAVVAFRLLPKRRQWELNDVE